MKSTCRKLFSYLPIDREAAQDLLNNMATRGWALERVSLGLVARFRLTERKDLRYFLDWTDPKKQEAVDYLQLCQDAGWDFLQRVGYWNLYVSRPGFSPSPIQTDRSTEYERFRGKVLRRMAIGGGISLAILGFYALALIVALTRPWANWNLLSQLFYLESLCAPILLLSLPLLLVGEVAGLLRMAGFLWAWRRALELGTMPPRAKAPEVWKILSALLFLYGVLIWLFLVADFLFNGFGTWGSAVGFLLGGILVCYTASDREKRRWGFWYIGMACLMLLAMALNRPLRAVLPGRLPPAPLGVGRFVDDGPYSTPTRSDGLWGSSASWWERGSDAQGHPDPQTLYKVSAQTWSTPAMAAQAAEREIREKDLVPDEGMPGVWRQKMGSAYLLLEGKTFLLIEHCDGEPEELLDAARTWMEKVK